MNYFANRHAVITGASSGLGAVFAEELVRRGCSQLTLVARDEGRLEGVAQRARAIGGASVRVIAQDLCQPDAVAEVVRGAGQVPVDILVNNAGFGSCGRFEEQSLETQLSAVRLNTATVLEMTHAFLPGMRARRYGGILNVASTAAFQPFPYLATYAATKSFVLSLSEALWAENRESGVNVTALCPGPTDTRFFERMGTDLPKTVGEYGPPLPVVRDGLDALAEGRCSTVSGFKNFWMAQGPRLLPRQVVARLGEKIMASKEHVAPALRRKPERELDSAPSEGSRHARRAGR